MGSGYVLSKIINSKRTSEMSSSPENSLKVTKQQDLKPAKKFSPFSVDSLLACKEKEISKNNNNNDEIEEHAGQQAAAEQAAVDLRLKKEEEPEDCDTSIKQDTESDIEDEEENSASSLAVSNGTSAVSGILPHRLPFNGLPIPSVPGWPTSPWIPQFRSPIPNFLQSKCNNFNYRFCGIYKG